jgi:hypothetical protein
MFGRILAAECVNTLAIHEFLSNGAAIRGNCRMSVPCLPFSRVSGARRIPELADS